MNKPRTRRTVSLAIASLVAAGVAGYLASDAISDALGITVSVRAAEASTQRTEPPADGAPPVAPEAPIIPSLEALEASMPDFLKDDDPSSVQLQQLQIYYRSKSPEAVWRQHMAPLLASAEEMAAADSSDGDYSEAELEAFRQQLDGFMVDMQELTAEVPQDRVLDYPQRIAEVREIIASATPEQLASMKASYDHFPGFMNTPSYVLGILRGSRPAPGALGSPVLPFEPLPPMPSLPALPNVVIPVPDDPEVPKHPNCRTYGGKGLGEVGTCSGCPAAPAGGLATIFALETAAGIAEEACEYVPENLTIIATEIPNPFKWLCIAIRMGLQIAAASVKFENDLNGECEQAYHLGIQHAYLDAEVSKVTTQKSHDFHAAYSLRIAIENDLLNESLDRISLFQLPRAQDGYLDAKDNISVQYVVSDTIGMAQAAGYDVRNALDEQTAANALYTAGDYKAAYDRYRRAYRTAVRVGREP
ncbi:MAG: hypothetical protein H6648_06100 [Caldilineae bacterium]|nr:hypothetical protein [Chloroflexota bacterium]MCB9176718.1 hypothetical protein [Caldilineae bacterium]